MFVTKDLTRTLNWPVIVELGTILAHRATERHDLRYWLFALRGRQTPFWLPTWGAELQLRTVMTASTTRMALV